MSTTIGTVTPGLGPIDTGWALPAPPAPPAAPAAPGGATSRDAQIADLPATSSDLNSLLALAQSSASATAPIQIPENPNQPLPAAPVTGRILSDAQLSDDGDS